MHNVLFLFGHFLSLFYLLNFSSGISSQEVFFRTFLVGLVFYCHSSLLYYKLYAVLLRSSVRLVKPLACFRGVMFGEGFWGSEALLLGTCPAG